MAPFRRKTKKNAEKLSKKYPDAYFETSYLHFGDSEAPVKEQEDENKDYFSENKKYLAQLDLITHENIVNVIGCKFTGKLFNTYLLYENTEVVYIIDQHAAHERLIFNRLTEQIRNRNVARQPMIVPYTIRVNAFETAFLLEHLEDIREMGFDILQGEENVFYVSKSTILAARDVL